MTNKTYTVIPTHTFFRDLSRIDDRQANLEIGNAVKKLDTFPLRHRGLDGQRILLVLSYAVIYEVREETSCVHLKRVIHQRSSEMQDILMELKAQDLPGES